MIDPYKMVFVNIILFFVLVISIYVYKYIYPKKKINFYVLLILISLLPLISIFRIGTYESGDLSINAIKTMEMYNSFLEGNFFPQWAGSLNATYGYPMFIFAYPLPYYISSFFHFLGLSFISSVKALLFFSFILSGVTMYSWLKTKLGKTHSFVASVFYLYAPYRLVDMHFRIDIGECLSFVFIPLTFLFIDKIYSEKKLTWVFLEAFIICFLILSHQAVSLFVFALLLFYILFNYFTKKDIKKLFLAFESLLLGLLLSLFYWLPTVYLLRFTHPAIDNDISFPAFLEFFASPWRYGLLFQGPIGQLSPIIGYIQWIIVLISVYFLFKKIRPKNDILHLFIFSLVSFFVIFIIMQSFSKSFWDTFPFLKNIQFSSRLLAIEAFLTAILAGIVTKIINKKTFTMIICILAILSTILNWGNRKVIPEITDQVLIQQLPLSTAAGEGLGPASPKWTKDKIWVDKIPNSTLEILTGNGKITQIERKNTVHLYKVFAEDNLLLKENTVYFPEWKVIDSNRNLKINYQNKDYPGIITFNITKGEHLIKVYYEETDITKFSRLISLITLIFIIFYFVKVLLFPKLKI